MHAASSAALLTPAPTCRRATKAASPSTAARPNTAAADVEFVDRLERGPRHPLKIPRARAPAGRAPPPHASMTSERISGGGDLLVAAAGSVGVEVVKRNRRRPYHTCVVAFADAQVAVARRHRIGHHEIAPSACRRFARELISRSSDATSLLRQQRRPCDVTRIHRPLACGASARAPRSAPHPRRRKSPSRARGRRRTRCDGRGPSCSTRRSDLAV